MVALLCQPSPRWVAEALPRTPVAELGYQCWEVEAVLYLLLVTISFFPFFPALVRSAAKVGVFSVFHFLPETHLMLSILPFANSLLFHPPAQTLLETGPPVPARYGAELL